MSASTKQLLAIALASLSEELDDTEVVDYSDDIHTLRRLVCGANGISDLAARIDILEDTGTPANAKIDVLNRKLEAQEDLIQELRKMLVRHLDTTVYRVPQDDEDL